MSYFLHLLETAAHFAALVIMKTALAIVGASSLLIYFGGELLRSFQQ